MKYLNSLASTVAALLLAGSVTAFGQQQQGARPGGPPGRGGFPFGPRLSQDDLKAIQKINDALEDESDAVTKANSNLVAAAFSTPVNEAKIKAANDELAKAREVWANKASKLMAEMQASDHKVSEQAIAILIRQASGRGMFGFGSPPGMGRGGRGPGRPQQGGPGNRAPRGRRDGPPNQ
ncbi:hypothetical protein GC207_03530 [bacterium]|nr:hypothetical protein [bacterium]